MNILADASLVVAGINAYKLSFWNGGVICHVADEEVGRRATSLNKPRSEVAIEYGLHENIGIIVIGNAPTAVLKALKFLGDNKSEPAPLIVALPAGFVNAESVKSLLAESSLPFITSLGCKGSSVATSTVINGLINLADDSL